MTPWTAQRLGAIVGAILAVALVIWLRTRPKPCPGAVTLEFHPPLAEPGAYRLTLGWSGAEPCTFDFALPLSDASAQHRKTGCGMALELRTQVQAGVASVSGLTFAAAPERFKLALVRNRESIYDVELEPKYAPYETTRQEDKHFCGDRALVEPPCLRGSSECAPFPASCLGPSDCSAKQVCCLTPEWARDYGPRAGAECTASASCFAQLGHLACRADADCPSDMSCSDDSFRSEFSPAPRACESRKR